MRRITICCLMLITLPARAQMVVSDPGSYMYYMEEISATLKMVDNAVEQVERLGGIKDGIEDTYASLNGVYNRARGLNSRLNRTANRIDDLPGNITEIKPRRHRRESYFGNDRMSEAKKNLDQHFIDPRDANRRQAGERDKRYEIRQASVVSNLATAETLLDDIPDRLTVLKDLASEIDRTKNLKDSQDLTNRILVEILETSNMLLVVLTHQAQADSLMNYEGMDEDVSKKRVENIEKNSEDAQAYIDQLSKRAGIYGLSSDQAVKKTMRSKQL